jgi:hypothetical protein
MAAFRIAMTKIVVDVIDTSENSQWLRSFKDRWKARLEQLDLWVVSYPIEVED